MFNSLSNAGCPIDPEKFIKCKPCGELMAGSYFTEQDGITVCEDRIGGKKHIEAAVLHELIHAYDHCRVKVDWNNCVHHACSEIRASNLSGECRYTKELQRGQFAFRKHYFDCVERRAEISVRANPACKDAAAAIAAASRCKDDLGPFGFIP